MYITGDKIKNPAKTQGGQFNAFPSLRPLFTKDSNYKTGGSFDEMGYFAFSNS